MTFRHLPLLRFVIRWYVTTGSPEGTVSTAPAGTGTPKFGVPSEFQVNFWTRVVRVPPQPCVEDVFAW